MVSPNLIQLICSFHESRHCQTQWSHSTRPAPAPDASTVSKWISWRMLYLCLTSKSAREYAPPIRACPEFGEASFFSFFVVIPPITHSRQKCLHYWHVHSRVCRVCKLLAYASLFPENSWPAFGKPASPGDDRSRKSRFPACVWWVINLCSFVPLGLLFVLRWVGCSKGWWCENISTENRHFIRYIDFE